MALNANITSKVMDSAVLRECNNSNHIPMGRTGPLVIKTPVVLADTEIKVELKSKIKFDIPMYDLKTLNRVLKITECKFIYQTTKLSIEGFIEESIEYSTHLPGRNNLENTIVNIPFKCITEIDFLRNPVYGEEYKKRISSPEEGAENWAYHIKTQEPIYCEVEYTGVLLVNGDSHEENSNDLNSSEESEKINLMKRNPLYELAENLTLIFKLKVLQNQLVFIPELEGDVLLIKAEENENDSGVQGEEKPKDIEIGFDHERGLIGKRVMSNK